MLDFIYYPVSFILWCWHWVFGHVFGESSGVAWALGIMFLVFTLRAIMFKPFVKQVRSMRQMQQFAPEIKKLQAKYKNDKQKLAVEMQKLQREHGFSPLGGCLPMLLQIPVFIGLFHVLRSFGPGKNENYYFDAAGNASYMAAKLFGAGLSSFITQPIDQILAYSSGRTSVILVSIPLMILASILTHLTARHSVARQNPDSATPQTAIMNKVTLYLFPLGVLIFGFFFPIGLLLYWLANNSWTLMQQSIVYRKIDREEEEKKTAAVEKRNALGPKPGQKPTQAKKRVAPAKPPSDPADTTDSTDTTTESTTPAKSAGKAKSNGTTKSTGTTRSSGTAKTTRPTGGTGTAKPTGTTGVGGRNRSTGKARPTGAKATGSPDTGTTGSGTAKATGTSRSTGTTGTTGRAKPTGTTGSTTGSAGAKATGSTRSRGTARTTEPNGTTDAAKAEPADSSNVTAAAEPAGAHGNGASPATEPEATGQPAPGSTEIPGLISDRSRSKKSGRKNR